MHDPRNGFGTKRQAQQPQVQHQDQPNGERQSDNMAPLPQGKYKIRLPKPGRPRRILNPVKQFEHNNGAPSCDVAWSSPLSSSDLDQRHSSLARCKMWRADDSSRANPDYCCETAAPASPLGRAIS